MFLATLTHMITLKCLCLVIYYIVTGYTSSFNGLLKLWFGCLWNGTITNGLSHASYVPEKS